MVSIDLPASKSIGARFLVASYFGGSLPAVDYFEDNDDLMVLQQGLLEIFSDEEPIDYGDTPIDVHASGTALRFLTAVCASSEGAEYVITGTPRLCSRPMKPLLEVLKQAGASIEALGPGNTGPYRVKGHSLTGGAFEIEADVSSQFISALMLAAPSWKKGMRLSLKGEAVSKPYVEMTAGMMRKFGIEVEISGNQIEVKPGKYSVPEDYKVEADWSSASFFYEAAVVGRDQVFINDLVAPELSLQGDARCASIFGKLGVKTEYNETGASICAGEKVADFLEEDFKYCPDLVLPVAVAALCKGVGFRLKGIKNLRHKESDRVEALCRESRKLGYVLKVEDDSIQWTGDKKGPQIDAVIDTYDDHRVAMAFAMVALMSGKIRIAHPEVVMKSFADFWPQLEKLGLKAEQRDEIMTLTKDNI